jgi:hypothetical protein
VSLRVIFAIALGNWCDTSLVATLYTLPDVLRSESHCQGEDQDGQTDMALKLKAPARKR